MGIQSSRLRVEICGGIAAGKTTLARLLAERGLTVAFEDFTRNPFVRDFYEDPAAHAFETEVTFLLQHYHQAKATLQSDRWLVCDFSFDLDFAYTEVTLSGTQQETFRRVHREVTQSLGPAQLIIYLRCSAIEELRRIRNRARAFEAGITAEYLDSISMALAKRVRAISDFTPVMTIDSDRIDYYSNSVSRDQTAGIILNRLASLQP